MYEELCTFLEPADLTEGFYPQLVLLGSLQQASFQKLLPGGLASHSKPEFLLNWLLPTDIDNPTSAAICTSCLVGDDPGDCDTCSSFFTSPLCLSTLPRVGGLLLSLGLCSSLGLVLLPCSGDHFHPSHAGMKNQPIRGLCELFRRCAPFFSFNLQVQRL